MMHSLKHPLTLKAALCAGFKLCYCQDGSLVCRGRGGEKGAEHLLCSPSVGSKIARAESKRGERRKKSTARLQCLPAEIHPTRRNFSSPSSSVTTPPLGLLKIQFKCRVQRQAANRGPTATPFCKSVFVCRELENLLVLFLLLSLSLVLCLFLSLSFSLLHSLSNCNVILENLCLLTENLKTCRVKTILVSGYSSSCSSFSRSFSLCFSACSSSSISPSSSSWYSSSPSVAGCKQRQAANRELTATRFWKSVFLDRELENRLFLSLVLFLSFFSLLSFSGRLQTEG